MQNSETVLITGASSGIGLELAHVFAGDGSNLVLVSRRREKLERLALTLQQDHGVSVETLAFDLSDTSTPEALLEEVERRNLIIDVLVNNAGFGSIGHVADLDVSRQLDMIQVNITTLTHLTRLLLPAMIERDRGGVLNVGSTAGFQAGPNMAVYYATKAYVLSFTEGLAEELRDTSVKVSCLAPGPTRTEFGQEAGMEQSRLFAMGTMEPHEVAKLGHRGLRDGQVVVVPGIRNRMGAVATKILPRSVTRRIVHSLQR